MVVSDTEKSKAGKEGGSVCVFAWVNMHYILRRKNHIKKGVLE